MIDFAQAVWLGAVVALIIAGAAMPLLSRTARPVLRPVRAHLGDKIGERVRGRRDVYI